jgi:hypothetical protein
VVVAFVVLVLVVTFVVLVLVVTAFVVAGHGAGYVVTRRSYRPETSVQSTR